MSTEKKPFSLDTAIADLFPSLDQELIQQASKAFAEVLTTARSSEELENLINIWQSLRLERKGTGTDSSRTLPSKKLEEYVIAILAEDKQKQSSEEVKIAGYLPPPKFYKFTLFTPEPFTPRYLSDVVAPVLNAILSLQTVIDEIRERPYQQVVITEISQKSPISVSLSGAGEAIQVVKDLVVPWRRKHAAAIALLLEREKQAEIEAKQADILERRALATKARAEAEKLKAEADKQRAEANRIELENEKLRLEIHRARIQLALDVLERISPQLSETDKISYLVKLLQPLGVLINSEVEFNEIMSG